MRITLVTNGGFPPTGIAFENRVFSIARGLHHAGHSITVHCLYPSEKAGTHLNRGPRGVYDGISYEYLCGKTIWPSSFWRRRSLMILGVARGAFQLLFRREQPAVIIQFSMIAIQALIYRIITWVRRIEYIQEYAEYPNLPDSSSLNCRLNIFLYLRIVARWMDGFLLMSRPIAEYFRRFAARKARILLVPITVDADRFSTSPSSPCRGARYICYCGSISEKKDGVGTLINSFLQISQKHPNVLLVLVGDHTACPDFEAFSEYIRKGGVQERVIWTGLVGRDEVPAYLCNAEVLALARPRSLQAEFGFPCKVGEYLATGKPVLVTNMGDLSLYVQDGVNAFVVEPDSVDAFATKLDFILSHPVEAVAVGSRGKETALTVFDSIVQGEKISEFLETLMAR